MALPDVIKNYNENQHTITKFKSNSLFNKNSIKKINSKCLLCENYGLQGNNIKVKNYLKKVNIQQLVLLLVTKILIIIKLHFL